MWNENEHPRDENGRFTNKEYNVGDVRDLEKKIQEYHHIKIANAYKENDLAKVEKLRQEVKELKELKKEMENQIRKRNIEKQPKPQETEIDNEEYDVDEWRKQYKYSPETIEFVDKENDVYEDIKEAKSIDEFMDKAQKLKPYQKGKANKNNFYLNTIAKFSEVEPPKELNPEYPDNTSYSRDGVSSEYWYTDDGVYRRSDHWGVGVATCDWVLDTQQSPEFEKGERKWGFCKWEDFIHKTTSVSEEMGYGTPSIILSNFNNIKEIRRMKDGSKYIIVKRVNDDLSESNKNNYEFGQIKNLIKPRFIYMNEL